MVLCFFVLGTGVEAATLHAMTKTANVVSVGDGTGTFVATRAKSKFYEINVLTSTGVSITWLSFCLFRLRYILNLGCARWPGSYTPQSSAMRQKLG